MNPLTSAALSLKETREMVIEMFETQAKWLWQFADRKLTARPSRRHSTRH